MGAATEYETMALTDRILLPLANETDTERTCAAIANELSDEGETPSIVITHVIEKGGGAPDKAPLSAREEQAESIFTLAENFLESEGFAVETDLVYGTDVVEEIVTAAETHEVTALVFLPRSGGGLLSKLFADDLSTDLLLESPVPVVVLPQPSEE
jgi:nucleotide-binding universal stress UspA family protein